MYRVDASYPHSSDVIRTICEYRRKTKLYSECSTHTRPRDVTHIYKLVLAKYVTEDLASLIDEYTDGVGRNRMFFTTDKISLTKGPRIFIDKHNDLYVSASEVLEDFQWSNAEVTNHTIEEAIRNAVRKRINDKKLPK